MASPNYFQFRRIYWLIFTIAAGLVVCGRTAFAASPPELGSIEIKKVGSPVVLIGKTQLRQTSKGLELEGHVLRNSGHDNTTHSHLMIKVLNAAGEKLREIPVEFSPHQIPHHLKMLGSSKFRAAIDVSPEVVRRIEIVAYEEN